MSDLAIVVKVEIVRGIQPLGPNGHFQGFPKLFWRYGLECLSLRHNGGRQRRRGSAAVAVVHLLGQQGSQCVGRLGRGPLLQATDSKAASADTAAAAARWCTAAVVCGTAAHGIHERVVRGTTTGGIGSGLV